MAYNYSNCKRWESEPFVLGLRIRLSANHPQEDICDELAGDYPKTFMWRGWHPRCMCSISPILMDKNSEEWKKLRKMPKDEYEAYQSLNLIKDVPNKFSEWCKRNEKKLKAARKNGKLPYFVRDNEKVVGDIVGWKDEKEERRERILKAAKKRHAARTPEKEAMLREYWAKKVAEAEARRRHEAIMEAARIRHAARTPEQIADIKQRAEARLKKHALIKKTANNVLKIASEYNEIDLADLKKYIKEGNLDAMQRQSKIVAGQIEAGKVDEKFLSEIIPNAHEWHKQFTSKELHEVYYAVKNKLESWSLLSLEEQKKKLAFEAYEFLGKNMNGVQQRYKTWEVSQAAYIKKLEEVQNVIDWENINKQLSISKEFKTKSKPYKELVAQLEAAIYKQDKQSANDIIASIHNKRDALQKAAEARNSKSKELKFSSENFTQKRKDAAIWNIKAEDANDYFFNNTDVCKWWKNLSDFEKYAFWQYTNGSAYITEALRGIEGHWYQYTYRLEETKKHIEAMTKALQHISLKEDVWIKRDGAMWDLEYIFGLRNQFGFASDDENGVRAKLLEIANKARDDFKKSDYFKQKMANPSKKIIEE